MSILKTVGKIVVCVSLSLMTIFSIIEYAFGQGYEIDEEAGKETVDKLTTDGWSLVQLLSRMSHTAISGGADTFYPGEINPVLVVVLSIVASVVAATSIALAWGGKISKLIMFVVLALVAMFMVFPIFDVPNAVPQ